MASAADLFKRDSKDFGPKRPSPPKFNTPGDKVQIMVTKEPVVEQQKDVGGGTFDLMYLEKGPQGWKPTAERNLVEGRDHFELTQIVIEGTLLETGEPTVYYVDNKAKREALEKAMEKTDLAPGNAIQITRTANVGRAFGWEFKIAEPKDK